MKKYFTDGLIQIAIVLSLMRTELDLNNFMNSYNYADDNIHDIYMGPLAGYTSSQPGHHWTTGLAGYMHPKNIDSYADAVFRDLHSLSYYRRFEGVNTNVGAWLVSAPLSNPSPPAADIPDNEQASTEQNSPENSSGGIVTVTLQANGNQELNEPNGNEASGLSTESLSPPGFHISPETVPLYPGSTLTKEDVDLIEILWRQDMDLGVGREMFDIAHKRELEKQLELEQHKKLAQELEWEGKNEKDEKEDDDQNYYIDGETGELVPASGELEALPDNKQNDSFQQSGTGLDESDGLSVEEAMKILEEQQSPVISSHSPAAPLETPPANLVYPNQVAVTGDNPVNANPAPSSNLQNGTGSVMQNVQEYPQGPPAQAPEYQRQDSFEQNWQDIVSMLNSSVTPGSDMSLLQQLNYSLDGNNTNPLVHNASLAPDVSYSMNSSFSQPQSQDQSVTGVDNSTAVDGNGMITSFGINSQNFTLSNNSAGGDMTFLDQLLGEDLMDINLEDFNTTSAQPMDTVSSSDSAVGSLSPGASSVQDHLSEAGSFGSSSDVASPFDGIEGATGNSYESSESKMAVKSESYDPAYEYSYQGTDRHTNHSGELNSSNSYADMKQVKHNHTYPLQPGQQPRERSSDKEKKDMFSRDEKRAKKMKLPFTIDQIIHVPVEEFNEMLRRYSLTESQLQLVRDIRRRGKNKVAAQNCRKRKLEAITTLEDELKVLENEKDRLMRERQEIDKERKDMQDKFSHLYQEVFASLRDDNGQPYDPNQYTLQQSADGNVFIVPHNMTQPPVQDHKPKSSRKRKSRKD